MDGVRDFNLYEMIYGSSPTIDPSSPSFTTTPTITTSTLTLHENNKHMLDDWGLDVIVNGLPPTIDASSPSFTTAPTTFTTKPTLPSNNNQMLNDWGLDEIVNGFYPTLNTSLSSSVVVATTTTPNTPVMLLDDHQTLDRTNYWEPHGVAYGLCSNIVPSSVVATTTQSTPTIHNQNWDGREQHFSSTIVGSPSSFTTTPSILAPTNGHYQRYSTFQGERLNLYQPMNENNVKQMMLNTNNPINVSKAPLSCKNWPILSIPFLGKITGTTTRHKQQQNRVQDISKRTNILSQSQHSLDISECTNINAQTQSKSNQGYSKRISC